MENKHCTSCGCQIPDSSTVCPSCGKLVEDSYSAVPQNYTDSLSPNSNYQTPPPISDPNATVPPNQPIINSNYSPNNFQSPVGGSVYPYPPTSYGYTPQPETDIMGIGSYLGPILLSLVPFVGGIGAIILLFVWAFGSYGPNRKNYARALLIMYAIVIGLIVLLGIIGASIGAGINSAFYY